MVISVLNVVIFLSNLYMGDDSCKLVKQVFFCLNKAI